MSNVVIFGVGNMGSTIAHAMNTLGHSLTLVDTNKEVLDKVGIKANKKSILHIGEDAPSIVEGKDIVISSLP